MERVDTSGNETCCSLGVATDRRCGSVSPTNLQPHTKPEGIKSSSTDPLLSSAHGEPCHDRNVRYEVLLVC